MSQQSLILVLFLLINTIIVYLQLPYIYIYIYKMIDKVYIKNAFLFSCNVLLGLF